MVISVAGILVVLALLLVGRLAGNTLLVALVMSVPFCATAFATLTALGGSSPLIYTLIVVLMLVTMAVKRSAGRDLAVIFRQDTAAWLSLGLIVLAIVSSIILPRLFAGEVVVVQVSRVAGRVEEMPLRPNSLNFTQTAYFVLSIVTYFAIRHLLLRDLQHEAVIRSLYAGGIVAAALGLIDLGGKIAGLGDVLSPIRTAAYNMMTSESNVVSGFYRVSGGGSEASTYAATTLPFLAFSYSYFSSTGSRPALALMLVLFALVMLSTSSTGMAGCAVLGFFMGLSILLRALRNRLTKADLLIVWFILAAVSLLLLLSLLESAALDAVVNLLKGGLFEKANSQSGIERSYFNQKSMEALWATGGMGVGAGSTRTSSWAVAVLSQLGVLGGLMLAGLAAIVAAGASVRGAAPLDHRSLTLVRAARSLAFGALLPLVVSGATIDPGVLCALGLAIVSAVRAQAAAPRSAVHRSHFEPRLA